MATTDEKEVYDVADDPTVAKSGYTLVVRQPFADYARGARIDDAQTVAAVLAGENAAHVIKLA